MAGSILASPTAERGAPAPPGAARTSRRGSRRGGASAATGWRSSSASSCSRWCSRSRSGRSLWQVAINDIDFTARLQGAVAGRIRSAPTTSGQDLLARMLYGGRISLAVGLAAMVGRDRRRHDRSARSPACRAAAVGRGADVADRPVPVAAAAAAAAAGDLSVPRRAEGRVRRRGRRLHPDRRGDRRLALDAGRAARARAVPLAAREGVRRGGARARRHASCARWCATSCRTRSGR